MRSRECRTQCVCIHVLLECSAFFLSALSLSSVMWALLQCFAVFWQAVLSTVWERNYTEERVRTGAEPRGHSAYVCVCVLQRKKKRKVSVKLCVLYLRVWLSYVCQPAQQSERNGRLKEYRHTMWVCVFLKHNLACVFSAGHADREESVTEIFVLQQWNLCYFSHWYPDRTTTVFFRATAFVIKFDRTGIRYSCPTAAKTLN